MSWISLGSRRAYSAGKFYVGIVSVLATLGPSHAATFYVATTGSDSSPGTQSAPFRNVSKGVSSAANPGDTVIVMDGTYGNEGHVDTGDGFGSRWAVPTLTHSGMPGQPITVRAQNRGMAILDGGNTAAATDTQCTGADAYFDLGNTSWIVIQGFIFDHLCSDGIKANSTAHDIVIKQNEFRNIGTYTINTNNGGSCYGIDGLYVNSNDYNFTFDSNVFHDIGRSSTGTSGCTKMHDHGLYLYGTGHTVTNNIFYNIPSGWAIQLAPGVNNLLIANNTFATNGTAGQDGQIQFWGASTDVSVIDNIFYQPTHYAFGCYAQSITNDTADRNIVYGSGTGLKASCLSAIAATNTLAGNPLFVNPSSFNFQLQSGSAAIDAGVNLSQVPYDFNGVARPQGISADIGAYEYSSGAPSACDLNHDGVVNNLDISLAVNMALGISPCTANIYGAGVCNVTIVQRVVNASITGSCVTQ